MKSYKTAPVSELDWQLGLALCENLVTAGAYKQVPNKVLAAFVGVSPQAMHQFTTKTLRKVEKKLAAILAKEGN